MIEINQNEKMIEQGNAAFHKLPGPYGVHKYVRGAVAVF